MAEKQMRIRGPKGTTKDSRIVVHVTGNPKTLDDPTHGFWGLYSQFGAMGELIKELNRIGHRHKALKMMTLDARRGYISLEGYDKNRVPFEALSLERLVEESINLAQSRIDGLLHEQIYHAQIAQEVFQDCTEGGAEAPVAP